MAETGQPLVSGVLLAAGTSSRFGDDNKLLIEIAGVPLIRRVAAQLCASRLSAITVVTGHEAAHVESALPGLGLRFAHNPDFQSGMASSLKCGIAAADASASGAMIVLGDMPGTTSEFIDRLLDAFEAEGGDKITFPVDANGRQGNPVIWPRRFFADIATLDGDKGAKGLIVANPDATLAVPVHDEAIFRDVDAPGDLTVDET